MKRRGWEKKGGREKKKVGKVKVESGGGGKWSPIFQNLPRKKVSSNESSRT